MKKFIRVFLSTFLTGALIAQTNSFAFITEFMNYNKFGQVCGSYDPTTKTETGSWDGQKLYSKTTDGSYTFIATEMKNGKVSKSMDPVTGAVNIHDAKGRIQTSTLTKDVYKNGVKTGTVTEVTSYSYDEWDRLTSTSTEATASDGSKAVVRTESYSYHGSELTSITSTEYPQDTESMLGASTVKGSDLKPIVTVTNFKNGLPVSQYKDGKLQTEIKYDASGHRTDINYNDDGTKAIGKTYYDDYGRRIKSETTIDGVTSTTTYNYTIEKDAKTGLQVTWLSTITSDGKTTKVDRQGQTISTDTENPNPL